MKVIFLDINGTMNNGITKFETGPALMPEHVAVLNEIVSKSGAGVVISSAFRLSNSMEIMEEEFRQAGFQGEIVGVTPSDEGIYGKDEEIQAFLNSNSVDEFVILDDLKRMGRLTKKLVCVYPEGLKPEHVAPVLGQLGCLAAEAR